MNKFDDCPVCGGKHCISWDSDCTFEDLGYDGEGIISFLHCLVCEADIEIRIPYKQEELGNK